MARIAANDRFPSEMVALYARPGFLIRRLHQIHVALFYEECNKMTPITPIQYGLLTTVLKNPGLDQKTLALEIGVDRANITDVIKRLEARGLIRRESCATDQRMKLVFITEAGRTIVHDDYENMVRAQERFLEPLDHDEANKLMQLLSKLVSANNGAARAQMRDF